MVSLKTINCLESSTRKHLTSSMHPHYLSSSSCRLHPTQQGIMTAKFYPDFAVPYPSLVKGHRRACALFSDPVWALFVRFPVSPLGNSSGQKPADCHPACEVVNTVTELNVKLLLTKGVATWCPQASGSPQGPHE